MMSAQSKQTVRKSKRGAEQNALQQRRLRAAADMARDEALKAANVLKSVKPTLRLIQTYKRETYSANYWSLFAATGALK